MITEGALLLTQACNCNNDAAQDILEGISALNQEALEYDQLVDEYLWASELQKLSDAVHLNPFFHDTPVQSCLKETLYRMKRLSGKLQDSTFFQGPEK